MSKKIPFPQGRSFLPTLKSNLLPTNGKFQLYILKLKLTVILFLFNLAMSELAMNSLVED
jgi:hypothetical protein